MPGIGKKQIQSCMNCGSHGQVVHLTCAMGMIAQFSSCGRTIDRQTEKFCLPVWLPGTAWQKSAQYDIKACNIWPHTNLNFFIVGLYSCVRCTESAPINVHGRTLHVLRILLRHGHV